MSGTYPVTIGDRGRFVLPAELRERAGWHEGTALVLVETGKGALMLTREQLRDLVRQDLSGLDLVEELLAERRRAAQDEEVGASAE